MFFTGDRLIAMREMIVAQDTAGRERALAKLLPMQRGDFEADVAVLAVGAHVERVEEVARALMDAATSWLRSRGMKRMRLRHSRAW